MLQQYCPQLGKVYKACIHLFSILPQFFKNLLQGKGLVHGGSTRTKSVLCILKLRFDYFTASLSKALYRSFQEDLNALVVSSFLVSFFVNRYQHTGPCLCFCFISFPSYLEHMSQPMNPKVVHGL